MGPLKTQVGEADAATSPKTTREKVSPTEKNKKRNHREQGWNLLEQKFLESLAASPEYVNTKRTESSVHVRKYFLLLEMWQPI